VLGGWRVLLVRVRAAVVDAEEEPQTLREYSGPLAAQSGSRQAKRRRANQKDRAQDEDLAERLLELRTVKPLFPRENPLPSTSSTSPPPEVKSSQLAPFLDRNA